MRSTTKIILRLFTWAFFSLWIISVILFFVVAANHSDWKYYSNFMGIDMLAGVGFFVIMIGLAILSTDHNRKAKHLQKQKNKAPKNLNRIKYLFGGMFVLLLIAASLLYARAMNLELAQKSQNYNLLQYTTTPTSTPTPFPTSKPKVSPTVVETDPIITCGIHTNCGGGTRQMKKSDCDQSVCCTLSSKCGGGAILTTKNICNTGVCCEVNGKWSMYPSGEKCREAQQGSGSNLIDCPLKTGILKLTEESCNQAIYNETYYNTYKALGGDSLPTYVPIPTENPVLAQQRIQLCLDRAQSKYDSAKSDCSYKARAYGITSSSWYIDCVQTATDNYIYENSLCK